MKQKKRATIVIGRNGKATIEYQGKNPAKFYREITRELERYGIESTKEPLSKAKRSKLDKEFRELRRK
jgi:hypothetical protein